MKTVYICSPLRGDIEQNVEAAKRYCREAVMKGVLPIAPHVYFTQFLDDTVPEERAAGMTMGLEMLRHCDEMWVYGEPTEGMQAEIAEAGRLGMPVTRKPRQYTSGHPYSKHGKEIEANRSLCGFQTNIINHEAKVFQL